MYKIESLLSARLFLVPQKVENRIFFVSNLSGRLSLYAMDYGGSVPEPLLPPEIALQNPHLMGRLFQVFPGLGKILIMLDQDGNEDYKPMVIPIDGGYPEPAFGNEFEDYRIFLGDCFPEKNLVYLGAASHKEPEVISYQGNLKTGELVNLFKGRYGAGGDGYNEGHSKVVLVEGYTVGDHVLRFWDRASGQTKLLFGTPLEDRSPDEKVPLNTIHSCHFIRHETALIFHTTLFADEGGLGWFELDNPTAVQPVPIHGIRHSGQGEFDGLTHGNGNRYQAYFNIDGCDWVYEGTLDEESLALHLDMVLVGEGACSNGVLEHLYYEKETDSYSLSFSTATTPTQIFTLEGKDRTKVTCHTRERVLGLPDGLLSQGEDASFTSFDGIRVSARLYRPAPQLGFEGPRPLVYYIHGGPQSQERPDFAWFSMPLIQFLTLNGFAVFVPNVRGSTGYGLKYTKMVDRDWGGQDRLDHVFAMTEILPKDERLDVARAAVVGRSYGGYMTLTLAGRHPELWSAACDMFGPYDLITFSQRIPETWKPYFVIALGDPEKDRDFLIERSPRTYIDQITAPLLVIQGKNDPRVVEAESRELVECLRSLGKEVDYLMFENEGHDVLKFENRVTCYNRITSFFQKYLTP